MKVFILTLIFSWGYCLNNNENLKIFNSLQNESRFSEFTSDLLDVIFYKYSNYSNTLSISQFQEFLDCSNGISQCSSTLLFVKNILKSHSLCENINSSYCHSLTRCTTSEDLLTLLPRNQTDVGDNYLSKSDFKVLLPLTFYQTEAQLCSDAMKDIESLDNKKPSSAEVWGFGILFVTLISACSLAGVSVLPLMAKEFYQKLLAALIGLAVGSLAASAVFHLIPQAFKIEPDADGSHSYLFISLAVLCGVWGFFMIESIIKIVLAAQTLKKNGIALQNSSSAQNFAQEKTYTKVSSSDGSCNCQCRESVCHSLKTADKSSSPNNHLSSEESPHVSTCQNEKILQDSPKAESCQINDVQLIYNSQKQAMKASFGHVQERPEKCHSIELHFNQGEDSVIATVAWMIIFGDGFHNFIDGVSIGAAFQQSILTGISISLAVMCEELPHELGDFAVLINSGMSMKQALFYNFLSATTCYAGMVIGILLGEFTQDSTYIFALAGGMFFYISLADMIPEMNETLRKATSKGTCEVVKVLIYQNVGMFIGIASLFALAYYQDHLTLEG